MNNAEITTTVTGEAAILRHLNGISEQNLALQIRPLDTSADALYQSSIMRIEEENRQLVLHQIQPSTWQTQMQTEENIEVTCHSAQGTLKFSGVVSLLEGDEDGMYCRLSIPNELSRLQLRSAFRVSTTRYKTDSTLELEGDAEFLGSCRDLSIAGARIQVSSGSDIQVEKGQHVNRCRLVVADVLRLSCAAKIRHVEEFGSSSLLLGINFQDLEPAQTNALRTAISKLERMNINT